MLVCLVGSLRQKKKGLVAAQHTIPAWFPCHASHKTTFPAGMSQFDRRGICEQSCCAAAAKIYRPDIQLNYGYFSSHSPAVIQHIYPSPLKAAAAGWMEPTKTPQRAVLQSKLGRGFGRKLFLSRSRSSTSCCIVSNF
jgi:hypothetical protein